MSIPKLSFYVIHAKRRSQWITLFKIAGQRSTSQAYWVTLALISNIANYLKYNYLLDCDGIDNVTLRKFSDFCSRHTVGVAGDDIMFHILVMEYGGSTNQWFLTKIHVSKIFFCVSHVYSSVVGWSTTLHWTPIAKVRSHHRQGWGLFTAS